MGFLDWMFRSRKTGRITLAQLPNWQFAVWLLASAVMWLGHPWGWVRAVLVVLASAALALWAGGEVLRGVNPFRRLLGFAVLSWLVFSLVRLS
jgi:ABC-type Co2+ transport system permease subunit